MPAPASERTPAPQSTAQLLTPLPFPHHNSCPHTPPAPNQPLPTLPPSLPSWRAHGVFALLATAHVSYPHMVADGGQGIPWSFPGDGDLPSVVIQLPPPAAQHLQEEKLLLNTARSNKGRPLMYRIFAHTADAGLHVEADTLDTLFAEAARALGSLIVPNVQQVEPRREREFHLAADQPDFLLVDWLQELLYTFETERLIFREFAVSIDASGLHATARGETVDEHRHQLEHEVKAITYHRLRVEQTPQGWVAEVIVDI
jgi:SHS2 domain-containing protein